LDYIASTETGEWRLLKGAGLVSNSDTLLLEKQESATVLFWDQLDQLVGSAFADDEVAQKHFRERADSVKQHLAMVFHRFLTGRNAVAIHLNGRKVEPWDPFMEDAEAVDPLPTETLSADDACIDGKTPPRKQAMHGEKILAEARKLGFRD
jgi:hypothetical protein